MSGRIALDSDRPGPVGGAGPAGPAGAGAAGLWTPAKNGLVAANLDPAMTGQNYLLVAGVLYLMRIEMAVASTVGSIKLLTRSPAGAALANAFVGLYSTAGNLLAQSADISAGLAATAPTSHALTSPLGSQAAGTEFIAALLVGSGTTMPTIQAAPGGFASAFASLNRAGTLGTGQTALPSTINPAAITATAVPWVGLGA